MDTATVREYKPEDSADVKNLILSILEKEYPFDQSAYRDTDINDISGTYCGKGNAFFVLEKEGRIIGTVGVKRETHDTALIRRLFVDSKHRKLGFGHMLLENAVEFCGNQNYKNIIFRATDRMFQAMSLCKKMGFAETENVEVTGFHIHTFVAKL